jgi:hypothetical protein
MRYVVLACLLAGCGGQELLLRDVKVVQVQAPPKQLPTATPDQIRLMNAFIEAGGPGVYYDNQ